MAAWAGVVFAVLDDDAVVDDGDFGGGFYGCAIIDGRLEEDVVAVPFALGGGGVDEGWELAVEGAGLAVWVGFVVVALEDLDFVEAHEEAAAVAAGLALDFAACGDEPLEMDLDGAEFFLGLDGFFIGDHDAIADEPCGWAAVAGPGVEVGAIEEDCGIGGWFYADCALGLDDSGLWALAIVDVVVGAGEDGCVLVAEALAGEAGECEGKGSADGEWEGFHGRDTGTGMRMFQGDCEGGCGK